MTKSDEKARERFSVALNQFVKEKSGNEIDDKDMGKLLRYLTREEKRLQRMSDAVCSDADCDVEKTDAEHAREEGLVRRYVKRICNTDVPVSFCHDPRGMQIRFDIRCKSNGRFTNNWDGETAGVSW